METNREIIRTIANFHLEHQEFIPAQYLLAEHLREDARDAHAWNLLGLAYLGAKNLPQAAQSFYTASTTVTDAHKGIYLYNYADALIQSGDQHRAKTVLELASRESSVAEASRRAMEQLAPGRPLPTLELASESQSGEWDSSLSVGSGYDSNVLLISNESIATVSRSNTASPFLSAQAKLEYSRAAGSGGIGIEGQAAFTYETNSAAQKFNTLYAAGELAWEGARPGPGGGFYSRVANSFDSSWLKSDGYKFYGLTEAIGWTGTLKHGRKAETILELPLRYQLFARDPGADAIDDRTGLGVRPAATHRLGFWRALFSASAQYERHLAHGSNYRAHSLLVPVSLTVPLIWSVIGSVGAEWSRTFYSESNPVRRDTGLRSWLSFGRRFGSDFFAGLDYGYRKNDSNVESATYEKHSATLTVTYDLL